MRVKLISILLLLTACAPQRAATPADTTTTETSANAAATASLRPEGGVTPVAPGSGCTPARRTELLSLLRASDPDGFAVFDRERHVGQKADTGKFVFDSFLDSGCADGSDAPSTLSTSVHETVHALRQPLHGYILIGGAVLPDFSPGSLFAPSGLAGQFQAEDPFVQIYLVHGQASSADDFTYLLDELNAYAHDLHTSSLLDGKIPPNADGSYSTPRDGTLALMSFVKAYADRAGAALNAEPYRTAVRTLWKQSSDSLLENCKHRNQMSEVGKRYLKFVCSSGALERPAACSATCN
jgi:hypothetical protein